jgi:hypothetical protein
MNGVAAPGPQRTLQAIHITTAIRIFRERNGIPVTMAHSKNCTHVTPPTPPVTPWAAPAVITFALSLPLPFMPASRNESDHIHWEGN